MEINNGTLRVTGMDELGKKIDSLLTTNPEMAKYIRRIIARGLKKMKTQMGKQATAAMDNDPRQAHKAVRYMVYRKTLGGNVNILPREKAGAPGSYAPERHPSKGRGGNRMKRSARTNQMEGYQGADRGFVLRFINGGARKGGGQRHLKNFKVDSHRPDVKRGSQGGDITKYGKLSMVNTGNRGTITGKNFFKSEYMNTVAAEIEAEIDNLITQEFKYL